MAKHSGLGKSGKQQFRCKPQDAIKGAGMKLRDDFLNAIEEAPIPAIEVKIFKVVPSGDTNSSSILMCLNQLDWFENLNHEHP